MADDRLINNASAAMRIKVRRTVDGKETPEPVSAKRMSDMEKMSKRRLRADKYLWGIYLMILVCSVIELYSASFTEVKGDDIYGPLIQHAIYLVIGLVLVLVLQNVHYKYFRKMAWPILFLSLGLLAWSNFHGIVINGAMRAIKIGGFTIQPAEIAKLAVVLTLAAVMARNQMKHGITNKGFVICLCIIGVFSGMMYKNGLTNMLLIVGVSTAMFIIGGLQMRKLGVLFAIYAVAAGGVYFVKYADHDEDTGTAAVVATTTGEADNNIDRTDLRKGRIARFLEGVNPQDTITDDNRQVFFANIAQAHGGLYGNGPGNSRESARLPLAFSDYIFSIIIEDAGFLGGILLMILYLSLVARAGRIAWKCTRAFPCLLITGCAVMIVFQALIHMAIVVGLLPVSGQPLPFISKGGTSIVVMSAAVGMMLSVSKYAVQHGKTKDQQQELKEAVAEPEDVAINPSQIQN